MKTLIYTLVCCLMTTACGENGKTAAEYLNDYSDAVLNTETRVVRYLEVAERDTGIDTLEVYAETVPADTLIGIRYQAESADSRVVYNGEELFVIGLRDSHRYLQKNDYEKYPLLKPFIPITGYSGSPFSFARVFRKIVADTTAQATLLPDTILDGLTCRRIEIVLRNKSIYGETLYAFPSDTPREFRYLFLFSKNDGLLRAEGMANDAGGYDMTRYTDYVFDRPEPGRKWMFADYPDARPYERIEYHLLKPGSPMPEFMAGSADGKTIGPDRFAGKPALILFWTMGCGASRSAIPLMNRLYDEYPRIEVLGLNNDDPELEPIVRFARKYEIRYPVAHGNKDAALAFGVNGWPTFMLFGRNGKLRFVEMGIGAETEEKLRAEIEKTIAEK